MSGSRKPFQYAALRVIPRVERGEAVNAGVVLFCRPLRFLGARTELDLTLLQALAPGCDPDAVVKLLHTIELIAAGEAKGSRQHDRAGRARPHRPHRGPGARARAAVRKARGTLTQLRPYSRYAAYTR